VVEGVFSLAFFPLSFVDLVHKWIVEYLVSATTTAAICGSVWVKTPPTIASRDWCLSKDHPQRLLLIGHVYILYITSLFYSVPFYFSFLVLFYYPSGTTTGARYISCTERDLSFFLFFVGARDGTRESVTRPHTTRSFLFFSACFSSLWSRSSHGTNSFRIPFHFCLLGMIPWESLISSDHWHTRPLYEILFDCILYGLQSMSVRVDLSQSLGIFSSFARRECYIDFCGMKKERSLFKKIKMSASLALNFTIVESNKWSLMIKG
jgi:hypothetical protein